MNALLIISVFIFTLSRLSRQLERHMMDVKLAESIEDLEKIVPVMLQLRPQYDADGLVAQMSKQQRDGYHVAYVEEHGRVLCVAGFVFGEKLAWGKHIYIDDLITDEDSRSRGAGRVMIAWLQALAVGRGCSEIHLDSGVQRFSAHKFYSREGFHIESHHFSIIELLS